MIIATLIGVFHSHMGVSVDLVKNETLLSSNGPDQLKYH